MGIPPVLDKRRILRHLVQSLKNIILDAIGELLKLLLGLTGELNVPLGGHGFLSGCL